MMSPAEKNAEAAAAKEKTRASWEDAADSWNAWSEIRQRWLEGLTEQLLDMTGIAPGAHVLDIAAGAGEQTLQIAERVGPQGSVLATDLSSNLMAHAAARAKAAGAANVETRVMDAENLELEEECFDAAVCRLGFMLFPHPEQALAGIRKALKPGGSVGGIVFTTPNKNPFISVPASIAMQHSGAAPPRPGQPGFFSLGAPGLLEGMMVDAGYRDVQTKIVSDSLPLESIEAYIQLAKNSFGAIREMLAALSEEKREQTWTAIKEAMKPFEGPEGLRAPTELLLVVGTK